ncbi:MAG TPA: hypothetical protein VII97_13835, partial [Anaerolineales bacterium]
MKSRILSAVLILLFITACNGTFDVGIEHPSNSTATLAPVATGTLPPSTTVLPTVTLSAATATLVPTNTLAPVPTNTAAANPILTNYLDDRSTPSQVIVSFYNAINRQEYLRAYNYWVDPATSLGSFTAWASGYSNTASVDLVFGQITGDPGMSQVYYTIPVILKTTAKNNTHTNYAACYVVHETNPLVYSAPIIDPMGIAQGSAQPSNINASDASVLATACSGYPVGGNPPFSASSNSLNIDKSNFVDNRSGPIETVSSLLNAINLKQYVRAYSYFQVPATFPGPYDPYAAGYSGTEVITVTFGMVQSEGAAGSLYFKVPLALKVLTTSAVTRTFVGCYTLHLAQPSLQATPPFQPLGIITGTFKQVDNGTDVNALLPTACN